MTTTTELTIQEQANRSYQSWERHTGRMLQLMRDCQAHEHYEWAESMQNSILESPLCVDMDGLDPNRDEVTWSILLGTGGPARRVLVTTDMGGSIEQAEYQFQDWFQPWTTAYGANTDMLREFAEMFYFGVVNVTVDGSEYSC